MELRQLSEQSDADLDALYTVPSQPWLRVNMISTVDGAATGPDGRSGGINNAADKRVFDTLRRLCDARRWGDRPRRGLPALHRARGPGQPPRVPLRLRGAPAGRC